MLSAMRFCRNKHIKPFFKMFFKLQLLKQPCAPLKFQTKSKERSVVTLLTFSNSSHPLYFYQQTRWISINCSLYHQWKKLLNNVFLGNLLRFLCKKKIPFMFLFPLKNLNFPDILLSKAHPTKSHCLRYTKSKIIIISLSHLLAVL